MDEPQPVKPVIRLQMHSTLVITWEEYEQIARDLIARKFVGDFSVGDQILAKILLDVEGRYHTVKAHYHPELYRMDKLL